MRLCYINYRGKDTIEIPPIESADYGSSYSEYLSYDSTTKKFTVLKDFNAYIVTWVNSYATASSSTAKGQFLINGTVVASYIAPEKTTGSKAGNRISRMLYAGDVFWNYTNSTNGYPQQQLKVYSQDIVNLNGIYNFSNEIS